MKKTYESPKLEKIEFDYHTVVATSNGWTLPEHANGYVEEPHNTQKLSIMK